MKVTGEYGKFFPIGLSPNYYNRSDADFLFPLSKQQALAKGYRWYDETEHNAATPGDVALVEVPKHDSEVCAGTLYRCQATGKPFRMQEREIAFCKTQEVPLPRVEPFYRRENLTRQFAIKGLSSCYCEECGGSITTPFADDPRRLLCETCFANELV